MKCKHNHLLMSLLTAISLVAVFLHMACHLIPILLVTESAHELVEPLLHNSFVTIAAWSFLPLMIYHMWKDKRMHKEIHRLQQEVEQLKNMKGH